MNASYELIQQMRNHGLTSDYQCAKALGCMTGRITNVKHGRNALNPLEVYKLAKIANMGAAETLEWIIKIETESPKARAAHAGQMAATVLLAAMASFSMMMPNEAHASQRMRVGGEGGIRTSRKESLTGIRMLGLLSTLAEFVRGHGHRYWLLTESLQLLLRNPSCAMATPA